MNTTPDGQTTGISRRRTMKALGAASVAALLTASMVACTPQASGGDAGSTQTKRKVIFVAHEVSPFFAQVERGFNDYAKMRGWDASFLGPQSSDVSAIVNLQENALSRKPDAIAFTRIDTTSFDKNILKAKEAGIPTMLFNVASDDYKKLGVGFVGQDFFPAGITNGKEAAKHAQEITGRKDGIIILGMLQAGQSALETRRKGAEEGIKQYNAANGTNFTTETLITSSDQAEAVAKLDAKWTAEGKNIVGFAHADWVSWYTALWAKDRGLTGKFANGGFDLVAGVTQGLKDKTIQWSIGQNPYAQGWMTASLLDMQMETKYPAYDYDTGSEVIDSSNIEQVAEREAKFAK